MYTLRYIQLISVWLGLFVAVDLQALTCPKSDQITVVANSKIIANGKWFSDTQFPPTNNALNPVFISALALNNSDGDEYKLTCNYSSATINGGFQLHHPGHIQVDKQKWRSVGNSSFEANGQGSSSGTGWTCFNPDVTECPFIELD